ncbi:MAG: glycogen debranching enzyme N-terminal domain-containing protein [Lentisphaerae bacterium]|nr:glycogen debranching enzyme N-terminal domain-containing protein [Lentisphaerota bacterium]
MHTVTQKPEPGTHRIACRGDVLRFELEWPQAGGAAYLRTNVGRAAVRRGELIRHVEAGEPILARDWHDLPMRRAEGGRFVLDLPLLSVGRFEAKGYVVPPGAREPVWPAGANVVLKVEPAHACCANTIYTAFVRQFGPARFAEARGGDVEPAARGLDEAGYTVIPPSGTFRALISELDLIMGRMGFRTLQLLPIHPVPTTYARMGRFGSPFAALDFEEVDPALAEFDRRTTPLDQFRELVDAVHARHGRLFLDVPLNHTGWASRLQIHEPDWFARRGDRTFASPGAWGVTWQDLSQLDYRHRGLWAYMAGMLVYWCDQGVDGFRCDAGYMLPPAAWTYIVAKVRERYPDTIFLLEGLGGKAETVRALLDEANLDWAYSELFQIPDRAALEAYLPGCLRTTETAGTLVHFAETHDNNRLAARSRTHARLRTALSALFAPAGAFGITNGVEWFADRKLDVHGAPPLNWGAAENQVDFIARLNRILETHPCFHAGAELRLLPGGRHNVAVLLREQPRTGQAVLAAVNLDDARAAELAWPRQAFGAEADLLYDLVAGRSLKPERRGEEAVCALAAGEAVCLTADAREREALAGPAAFTAGPPARATAQRLRAKALEVLTHWRGPGGLADMNVEAEAAALRAGPAAFCERAAGGGAPAVTRWQWPEDTRRVVPVPAGHVLLVRAPVPFTAVLREGGASRRREVSLPRDGGGHFAVIMPLRECSLPRCCTLELCVNGADGCRRGEGSLRVLPAAERPACRTAFNGRAVRERGLYALCTNGRGAMAQVRGAWGRVRSQYDCLLGANLDPGVPVDRHIMLTRCRAWAVYHAYSRELNQECLRGFGQAPDGTVTWSFDAPTGMGRLAGIDMALTLEPGANAMTLRVSRRALGGEEALDNDAPLTLIVRPDIEDRPCHAQTKAYLGPENAWPAALETAAGGFRFAPDPARRLDMTAEPGTFTHEPEWLYMVAHPWEQDRGLDGQSDLFSPGYFALTLRGGDTAVLRAAVNGEGGAPADPRARYAAGPAAEASPRALQDVLRQAMQAFVVARGADKTVIAGYPWFLDWGRDALICLRGLIAAGHTRDAASILRAFAQFEQDGTLPNMIRGDDASNRDTSDAPLWFCAACRDLVRATGSPACLDESGTGRTLRDALHALVRGYMRGTPNGIRVDPASGLVYSPPHFTWMDTQYPAGTPREGYPVEIQALWWRALDFLAGLEPDGGWSEPAGRVRASIRAHFRRPGPAAGLCDCLLTGAGVPASEAEPDDLVRPNQLLAVTLGAEPDRAAAASVLSACEALLVPGAIRSLADRPAGHGPRIEHEGHLLNDPEHPYWGAYRGDEDTRRKPAYHNGTAWTWLMPSYAEALVLTYGAAARPAALALLGASRELAETGCIGQIPEIVDGDAPHAQRGCGAQAWGATELYRVLDFLTRAE